MADKRNDRRSGPEGSFWWFDWLGNLDDRAELLVALGSRTDFEDAWNSAFYANEGLAISEDDWTDARISTGLWYWCFNSKGIMNTLGPFAYYEPTSFALAEDGGARAVGYYGAGSYDPYSLHLGYWYANTSDSVSSGNSINTNYGGNGKVWQTFSSGIDEPYMRGKQASDAMMFFIKYDDMEKQGFRNRFGVAEGTTVSSIMENIIDSIAAEIEVTKLSSQPIFNEIVLDKGFDYSKRSFLSAEEEAQSGIASDLSFVSASAPTNGGY